MANAKYTAAIQLQVDNLRALDKVESTLKNINAITDRLKKKKLDLYDSGRGGRIGGRGPMRDAIGVASRQATLTVKGFLDGSKKFGKSVNSINSQLGDFNELINSTAIKGKGIFDKQRIEVQNLAEVFTQATKRAKQLAEAQENLRRTADPTRSGTVVEAEVRNRNRRSRVRRGRERQQRFERARSSALIGGAFPLLFGQGVGASALGAAGGFGGGLMKGQMGFALSLVGTSVGAAIDGLVKDTAKLGQALSPLSQDIQTVTTSLGLQNSAQAAQLQLLEQVKGKTAAFNVAMQLMANDLGQKGVNALKVFGESARILGGEFKLAITRLQAFSASFLNFVLRVTGAKKTLDKADQERTINFAAIRGDEEAKAIQAEQKRIDQAPLIRRTGAMGQSFMGQSQEIMQDQNVLNRRKEIFTLLNKERVALSNINQESLSLSQTLEDEVKLREKTERLIREGNSKTLAEKLAKNEVIFEKAKENIQMQITLNEILNKDELDKLKIKEKNNTLSEEEKKRLDDIRKIQEFLNNQKKHQNHLLDEANKKTKTLHDETKKLKVTRQQIADLLADETTSAVMGLIEGTRTLGESLASVAKSLAKMFLNVGFQNMFNTLLVKQEQGGYNRAGSFKAFQYGGVVSSPTLGMIGEGGEPEYVIPSSKMDGAMARYSAGARGGAVIPGGSGASGTVAGSSGNTIVEYTGPVLNFNGDEYVPKTAVPEIINTAARQGGEAGKTKAISALRNSRSQRASLGL